MDYNFNGAIKQNGQAVGPRIVAQDVDYIDFHDIDVFTPGKIYGIRLQDAFFIAICTFRNTSFNYVELLTGASICTTNDELKVVRYIYYYASEEDENEWFTDDDDNIIDSVDSNHNMTIYEF